LKNIISIYYLTSSPFNPFNNDHMITHTWKSAPQRCILSYPKIIWPTQHYYMQSLFTYGIYKVYMPPFWRVCKNFFLL